MRQAVTAIVTTYNEEKNIRACLESLKWCDEIMVVDSFSTDTTVEIAAEFTDKIYQREYKGPADQKNWIIPQAGHEWVLLLDADELIPNNLKTEIQELLANNFSSFDQMPRAFWIKRQNWFLGSRIKHSGWANDKVIRLFKRECRYDDKQVHEEILTTGKIDVLKNPMHHCTASEMKPFINKWERYTTWSAIDANRKGVRPGFFHFVIKPSFRFTRQYVIQLGFLDGWRGFIICALDGAGVLMRYIKLYGMQHKKNNGQ